MTKIILHVLLFIVILKGRPINASTTASLHGQSLRDSLPALNTIADADIDTVRDRIKTNTIDVTLKTGKIYSYNADKVRAQWENKPGLAPKIERVVNDWRKTFTKAEQPPAFPGGDEAWNAYVKKYVEENKHKLNHKGSGNVSVQFIIDKDGEISGVEIYQSDNVKLSALAVDIIENSPFWLPAIQNGHKVVSYQKVMLVF